MYMQRNDELPVQDVVTSLLGRQWNGSGKESIDRYHSVCVTGKSQFLRHVGSVSLNLAFAFLCFCYYNHT